MGPVSMKWLNEIGIYSYKDLEQVGSVQAYVQLKRLYPQEVSLNLLYGMEAALMDIHWTKLPKDVKSQLKGSVAGI